ncbi:uncharacterized protein BP5553_07990 [Venustampulla echinocandica]|uniref:GPR1 protein n=1 Tax=Venustampulla echinocandica TaxID=2656787 RepID=A0A370TFE8_9HELO|nr:uncharacterized protein BP5553_07990 [Venustampulla echinocandica]RDL33622.1 hypothetical protein BP5553_07990 [Venustampulla echinocandica]
MATENHVKQAPSNGEPLEKDFSNTYYLGDNMDQGEAMKRIHTAGSISISPELFEKIYLSPKNAVKGDLRKTFGNPTPIALVGFLLCLSPLCCDLMGWRGAGGNGAAGIASYMFFGGITMFLGGLLEFFLGNTFPSVVFCSFGAFWLTFGGTLQPSFYAYALYAPEGQPASAGMATVGFLSSFAFFLLFMGVLCLVFLICSLRTNVVFVVIFFTLVIAFGLLAGAYWQNANSIMYEDPSAAALAGRLQVTAGAILFITALSGWWIFFAIMLAALDFPFQIPVGDLSTVIKGYSERMKAVEHMA